MLVRLRVRWIVALAVAICALTQSATISSAGAQTEEPAGTLIAFDAQTGRELWRAPTPPVFTVEDVSKEVVAGRGSGCHGGPVRTHAARSRDGKKLWQAPLPASSAPVLGRDSLATGSRTSGVVVSNSEKAVRGLEAVSGHELWSVPIEHPANVAVDAKTVVIAEPKAGYGTKVGGVVRALDRATGRKLWSRSVRDSDMAVAALGPGTATIAFARQQVSGTDVTFTTDTRTLDTRAGIERWRTDGLAPLLVTDNVVVAQRGDRGYATGLVVLDAATGDTRWERPSVPGRVLSMGSRLGFNEVVPIRPSEAIDRFTVVDAATGAVVWERPLGESERGVAASATAVLTADPTAVTLVDAGSGITRWRSAPLPAGTSVNSAALAGDRVYVAVGCSYSD